MGQSTEPWFVQENFLDAIVAQYGFVDRAKRFAEKVGVPLVWWDSGVFSKYNSVYRDELEVSRQVTQKLIEMGHQRIGFVADKGCWVAHIGNKPNMHYSFAHRFESYNNEMRARGLCVRPITLYPQEIDELARQMKQHQITAAICNGCDVAVYLAALTLKWRVPQDISIVTLDREARIVPTHARISGMLYDRFSLGEQTADMVLSILEEHQSEVPSIQYVGQFDPGDTLAPPRKK